MPGLEVDDVIQETYSLVAARERFDDIQHPKAYLFQTARSLVVRHVRRARIVSFQALEEMEDDISPTIDLRPNRPARIATRCDGWLRRSRRCRPRPSEP